MNRKKFIGIVIFFIFGFRLSAQTDREFWFAAPVVTPDYPTSLAPETFLLITAHDLPANVLIEMPAEPLFTPIQITVPAFNVSKVTLTTQLAIIQNAFAAVGGIQGKNNKGIHITSDNYINVQFESNKSSNSETFTLKGRNALGTDFYTPFQNDMINLNNSSWSVQGYSAFDIVFTENNTFINLYIPAGKGVFNGPSPARTGTVLNIGPFNRGESFTGIPAWLNNLEVGSMLANDVYGRSAVDHLSGLRITTNGKKIAVTIKDDVVKSLVGSTQADLLGDQIIPVSMLGKQYIALRGQLQTGNLDLSNYLPPPADPVNQGRLYIVGTVNNTTININGVFAALIQAGETYVHQVISDVTTVSSPNANFYCMQVSGFASELADEILPRTDVCTGSTQVGFSRPSSNNLQFGVLVRTAAADSFLVNGVQNTTLFPPGSFTAIPGTDWSYYRNLSVSTAVIPVQVPMIISNTKDVFHLYLLNGLINNGARMSIPSGYAPVSFEGFLSPYGNQSRNLCYGDEIQLVAHGGSQYSWMPTDYLTDRYSPVPVARPLTTTQYVGTITGACGLTDTIQFQLNVAVPMEARFTIDTTQGCAPKTTVIHESSYGLKNYYWNFGDGQTYNHVTTESKLNDSILYHTYTNTGPSVLVRNIRLIVENSYMCRDTLERSVTVFPQVFAGFSYSPDTVGCSPFPVRFTQTSVNAQTYSWNFGAKGTSALASPTFTFNNPGPSDSSHLVRMIAISPYYCSDTLYQNFVVRPFVTADFTATPDEGCSPLNVAVQNKSSGGSLITQYDWDFGDGATGNSSAASLNHTYNNTSGVDQFRNLQLIVQNVQGCKDTLVRTISVFPEVSAVFTRDVAAGCNPLPVQFTKPVNNTPVTYQWNFGNGVTSGLSDPSLIFSNIAPVDTTFITQLIVSSARFCRDTFTLPETVRAFIDADFALDRFDGCVEFDVSINNNSLAFTGISGYEWVFGDGSPNSTNSAPSFTHTYTNPGANVASYNLSMVVQNAAGCKDTMTRLIKVYPEVQASFGSDFVSGCNPLQVNFSNTSNAPVATNYFWNFGDNTTSLLNNPGHLFTNPVGRDTSYNVILIARSDKNCADTVNQVITVYAKIFSSFSVDTASGCSPFPVQINNEATGGIAQYFWDFKDGSPVSNDFQPQHIYKNQSLANAIYDLELVVKNNHACYDTFTRKVTVYPEVVASFTPDSFTGCNPFAVSFSNNSNEPVSNIYNWDFGDGSTSNQRNPSHTFVNLGPSDSIHTVRLHAVSANTCEDDTLVPLTVFAYIDADFKINDPDICSEEEILIKNLCPPGVTDVFWDFEGDGTIDSGNSSPDFLHPFSNLTGIPVTNNITLKVKNTHQCFDSIVRPVLVYPKVTADFAFDSAGCSPFQTQFVNNSLNGNVPLASQGDYYWNFGDTIISTQGNPTKMYYNYTDADVIHTVKLVAQSQYFCKDTIEKNVYVYHQPRAIFEPNSIVDCPPFNLQLFNTSFTTTSTFYWDFGDGSGQVIASKEPVSHIYTNFASFVEYFDVELKAVTSAGCTDSVSVTISAFPQVTAAFDYDSSGCSPFVAGFRNNSGNASFYEWNFGDGKVSELTDPFNRFLNQNPSDTLFPVQLIATSLFNCKDTLVRGVTVFGQPEAEFLVSPTHQVYEPEPEVTIQNISPNQSVWLYNWDFDDGTTSTENAEIFKKTYFTWADNSKDNRFNIQLVATNPSHPTCIDTIVHAIRIFPKKPEIEILSQGENGCEPFTVQFRMNSLYAYPDSFYWDFGDGSFSREAEPLHTFQSDGEYNIMFSAKGDGGISYAFAIVDVHPSPEADFDITPTIVQLPDDKITTLNKSHGSVSWLWDFGDGNTSAEKEPQHLYQATGKYDILLMAISEHMCIDSLLKPGAVTVEDPAILEFPSAFTPDMSGPQGGGYAHLTGEDLNNIFYPYHQGVLEYHLEIYTRWGEKLFETDDIYTGWDGYFENKLCKQDVYVWKARGRFINNRDFYLAGDVTLLHKR